MDSGSDWDSLTGDEPSFVDVSMHNSKRSSKQKKDPQQEYQDYRGTSNLGFKTVELEDRSHVHDRISEREKKQRKKQNITNNDQEDLPYTQFTATPNRKKPNKRDSENNNSTIHQKPKTNYTIEQPVEQRDDVSNSWDLENSMKVGGKDSLYGESIIGFNQQNASPRTELSKNNNNNVLSKPMGNNTLGTTKETYFRPPTVLSLYENKDKEISSAKNNEKRFFYEPCHYNVYTVDADEGTVMTKYSDRFEPHIRRLWEEIFGVLRVLLDFFVIFILESLKLVFIIIFQRLLAGIITSTGDHVLKPLFSSLFNSIIQPLFILLWNTTRGVRSFLQPVVSLLSDILQPVSGLLRSFRLFEYRNERIEVKEV